MPDPYPGVAPWEPSGGRPHIVSDGPDAVSAAVRAASLWGRGDASPPDAEAVTDTPPEAVTDTPSAVVSDTDTPDADTGGNLPAVAEFGREISPAARFGIAATRSSGAVIRAAGKGAVKTGTWTQPPQSLSGHAAWVNNREWIPEEVKDEPLIGFLVFARHAWGWTAGLLFAGLGNAVNWLRLPQHFLTALAAFGLLYLLVIR
jgi:hypothetical protein